MSEKDNAPRKAYQTVVDYIKAGLRNGEFAFGDELPSERILAEKLGLGRNSVREALRALEQTGLVESRQGQGNFLSDRMDESLAEILSLQMLSGRGSWEELSRFRCAIEREAFLIAVRRGVPAPALVKLRDAAFRMAEGESAEDTADAERDFHAALAEASGNRFIVAVSDALSKLSSDEAERVMDSADDSGRARLKELHRELYEAAVRRSEKGLALIEEHYAFVEKELKKNGVTQQK
ncbi:MAG: GntR family transcriptional regulator [Oscillospiraceae bacterium]|nr:GntR family transcriptional regulator [Oscillospiraceae bacterium]